MATITKRFWSNKTGAREAWVLAFTDAAGERHKEQFAKKRDADARRVEVEGQVKVGAFRSDAAKVTVADACGRYLTYLEGRRNRGERVTATYLATTRAELENYILCTPRAEKDTKSRSRVTAFSEGVGHFKLSRLTPGDVGDLAERLRTAGVSVSTTRRAIASLSRALAYASSKNLVGINAARGTKVIGTRDEGSKKIIPPTKAAMSALLKAADPAFKLRLQFAALSGLRASEQWALRWRNLDLKVGTVRVENRVDIYGDEDTTKSAAGQRTVPIGKPLVAALKAWRESSKHAGDDDLVFPDSEGGHVRHGNMLKRDYAPLMEKVDGDAFNWHALRHFAVSCWIEDGRPPKTVQTWAGHATLAITMDRYGHLFPSDDHHKAMDRIAENLFR